MPAEHKTHPVAPPSGALGSIPTGHSVQKSLAAREYCPLGQVAHDLLRELLVYFPAAHLQQGVGCGVWGWGLSVAEFQYGG